MNLLPPPLSLFFLFDFSDANRNLQAEYDRLKQQHEHKGLSPLPSPPEMMPTSPQSPRDAELIAEAKLLRQHKGRLEARMQILEDHNKQLESQLHRLRQLLEQVSPRLPWDIYRIALFPSSAELKIRTPFLEVQLSIDLLSA